jgi:hypothetical protein
MSGWKLRGLIAADAIFFVGATLGVWMAVGVLRSLRRAAVPARTVSLAARPAAFLVCFFALWAVLLAWFIGQYPGHLQTDQCRILLYTQQGFSEPWLSTLYALWSVGWQRWIGNFPALALPNILLIAFALADVLSLCHHRLRLSNAAAWKRGGVWFVLLGLCTSIPLALHAIHLSHDTPTAALKLCLAALVVRWTFSKIDDPAFRIAPRDLALGGLLCVLCAWLRRENLVLVVGTAALIAFCRWREARGALALSAVCLLCVLPRSALERTVTFPYYTKWVGGGYEITIAINPLGAMVTAGVPLSDPDRAAIEGVISIENLRKDHHPRDIIAFWKHVHGPYDQEKVRAFAAVYLRLALRHPAVFFRNRAEVFLGSFQGAFAWKPYMFRREQRADAEHYNPEFLPVLAREGLSIPRDGRGLLERWTSAARDAAHPYRAGSPAGLLWNFLPQLSLVLAAACLWKTGKAAGNAALLFLMPLGVIFLFAPASHTKYVVDVYTLGWLIVPLWLAESAGRRLTPAASTAAAPASGS